MALPKGRERELYLEIAFRWRELAQIAMAREVGIPCTEPPPNRAR